MIEWLLVLVVNVRLVDCDDDDDDDETGGEEEEDVDSNVVEISNDGGP